MNREQKILKLEFERDRLAKLINKLQAKRWSVISELQYYQNQKDTWEQTDLTPFIEQEVGTCNVHNTNDKSGDL